MTKFLNISIAATLLCVIGGSFLVTAGFFGYVAIQTANLYVMFGSIFILLMGFAVVYSSFPKWLKTIRPTNYPQ